MSIQSAKYVIYATIEIDGVVEKPDVIGALFGQTEGLLGDELDLRELQEKGKISRIQVDVSSQGGKTTGEAIIPSNLDRKETALIAAAVENVDKVGPCPAKITVTRMVDVREEKRKKVLDRAKELLKRWDENTPESKELVETLTNTVRQAQVMKFGPEALAAGPDVETSDEIILVEGRADVLNLLKHGYRNAVAAEGITVPESIRELTKRKQVTAFLDGDRGGTLILKSLLQVGKVDLVARAPTGREVEELTGKEITKALESRVAIDQYLAGEKIKVPKKIPDIPEQVSGQIPTLKGTLEAQVYGKEWVLLQKLPVRDLADSLKNMEGPMAVVFDGIITQRLIDLAEQKGITYLIGVRVGSFSKKPVDLKLLSFEDLGH